jgi:hypothetical protein
LCARRNSIPRHTARSSKLYRSRGAVEREFGRLKHEWALLPLRVRGIERVRLHADLTILAKLSCALAEREPCRSRRRSPILPPKPWPPSSGVSLCLKVSLPLAQRSGAS